MKKIGNPDVRCYNSYIRIFYLKGMNVIWKNVGLTES